MNILCVEPNVHLAQSYQQALVLANHSVQIAHTAQMALDVADQSPPDVVLLELQLPGANGIAFLQEFRSYADWHTIPIVVHSYVASDSLTSVLRQRLQEQFGVVAWLYKPNTSLVELQKAVAGVRLLPADFTTGTG